MKSVSFPVSWLNSLSEIINEEAGVSSSEILSTVSWGISMRSRAALALSNNGTDRAVCFARASRSFEAPTDIRGNSSGIDTTFQRIAAASFWNSIAVNTCVPSGSSGFSILTGTSNNGEKPRRTKSLLNLRLTKTEIGTIFLGATPAGAEPGTWRLVASGGSEFDTSEPCFAGGVPLVLPATVKYQS